MELSTYFRINAREISDADHNLRQLHCWPEVRFGASCIQHGVGDT
jgi:hypothetical protein